MMARLSSLFVLGAVAILGNAVADAVELPELDYEWYDLEPYISEEVSGLHDL